MEAQPKASALISRYGFIVVQGTDAMAFLQAQFSADIAALEEEQSVLTGWHDPKGRVLCCPRVVRKSSGFWLALPRAMVGDILSGLQRYVFRSKVRLSDATEQLAAAAVIDSPASAIERYEIYAPVEELNTRIDQLHEKGIASIDESAWELADIRAGLPDVCPATSGMFTGQMLNLDLIGGISFTKGCYPGQEIIARTHNLGRVKRRMQRYVSTSGPRQPGDALFIDGRRAGQVVRSVASPHGSESLVVTAVETPAQLTAEDDAILTPESLPYALT